MQIKLLSALAASPSRRARASAGGDGTV